MMSMERIVALATPRFAHPLERPVPDDDVAAAASQTQTAKRVVDLKVIAYALHIGVLSPEDASAKMAQPEVMIRWIANILRCLTSIDQDRLAESIERADVGYSGPVHGNSQEEGWAFTILDAFHDCSFARLADVLNLDDPAEIGLRWTVQGLLPRDHTSAVVHLWAERGDALRVAAARFLVACSVEAEITGVGQMISISALPRVPRAIIAGRILSDLLARGYDSYRAPECEQRRVKLILQLSADVPQWIEVPTDLRAFIDAAQVRDIDLIAFVLSLPLAPRALREARNQADELLRRAFQKITTRGQLKQNLQLYITGWMLASLTRAAISISIGPEYYRSLVNNLAFDEYARDVDFELYLNDRQRAILLAAIGVMVSANVADSGDIRAEAESVARILSGLPEEKVEVLTASVVAEFSREYAIEIPSR